MIAVHQTRPAGQAGQWLQNILQPVAEACRLDNPPPLEVRPTGMWSGWAEPMSYSTDGRVCVSSKVVFWKKERIISVYIHESAHRLLSAWGAEVPTHGPVFFTLNSLLINRSASFFRLDYQFGEMDFYALQDRPDELLNSLDWQEICLRFARETASKLANQKCSAESLAGLVVAAWPKFLATLQSEQNARNKTAQAIKDFSLISTEREKHIVRLERWLLKCFATFSIALLLTVWVWLK